ncbi:hypothetical protein TIFTF001_027174 [Ficus carica]|uniref:Bulb-type lectin domain-containing protein n=1 Tax=Ficus carica TaxID=3494 RepID=A0AA88IY33_FICCA|nr:hypothetical protein TIFTF001_027174 [Ficus carica]
MDTKTNLRFMIILFLYLFLNTNFCLGADTISSNHSISRVVSVGGVFELGFFRPGNSLNYYIDMWYKQVSPRTVVWVANREKPVSNTFSSELTISDGNLVIFDESNIPIWSTNVNSTRSASVQAVLLDNGNLILSEASEDPAPGPFSLELNPNDNSFVILWNRSRIHWTSGPWNGQIFSLVPEMRRNYIYDYKFVSYDNESYITYSVYSTSAIKISRCVLEVSGQIKQLNWLPSNVMFTLFVGHMAAATRTPCSLDIVCTGFSQGCLHIIARKSTVRASMEFRRMRSELLKQTALALLMPKIAVVVQFGPEIS